MRPRSSLRPLLPLLALSALGVSLAPLGCSSTDEPEPANAEDAGATPSADDGDGGGPRPGAEPDASCAPNCDVGEACAAPSDCAAETCIEGVCYAPTANDGVKNGDETDLDCGGGAAPPCDDAKACVTASDCKSAVCDAGVCAAPTNTDGVKNGNETDADCGSGGSGADTGAPACDDGSGCVSGADCVSGSCKGNLCAAPANDDGVKNGNETDVDCGSGPDGVDTGAPACAVGKACLAKADCAEADCVENVCTWTSTDGFKNGTETDVDCGGGAPTNAPPCATGKKCGAPSDCKADACIRDGAKAGTCAEAPSCGTHFGGQTCGAGEVGAAGAAHESCCRSLPLPATFQDRLHPGKRVYLDKYEITAGRMREFITRLEEASASGEANVRAWIEANMPPFWSSSADATKDWTRWLPTGKSTLVALPRYNTYLPPGATAIPDPAGNVGTDWALGPGGWYFYMHGHNCDREYGYPTYWYPEALWSTIHTNDPARVTHRMTKAQLDVRSLNCTPQVLLAAFCAWDGGQLATVSALQEVTGVAYGKRNLASCSGRDASHCDGSWFYGTEPGSRFGLLTEGGKPSLPNFTKPAPCPGSPGCAFANYSNDAGQLQWSPAVPYYYRPDGGDDYASRIAAPGRMIHDTVRYAPGDEPWMDLRGNLQEQALDDRKANTYVFGGVHYDSIGRRAKSATPSLQPEFKIAQAGGRCMRFRDE